MQAPVAAALLLLCGVAATPDEALLLQIHEQKTEVAAAASMAQPGTEPCKKPNPAYPWPSFHRYCHPANDRVCAPKRGLSIEASLYIQDGKVCKYLRLFTNLRPWWFNFDMDTCTLCSSQGSDYDGCEFNADSGFVPMAFNQANMRFPVQPAEAILGFHWPEQAAHGMSAAEAAAQWATVEAKAASANVPIPRISSPVVTGNVQGFLWLDDFFAACDKKCKVDFVAARIFKQEVEGPGSLQQEVEAFGQRYGLPVWLVEFNAGGRSAMLDAKAHYDFATKALPMLELHPNVEHYAWSTVCNTDIPGASLVDCNTNVLTDLGLFYRDFSIPKPASLMEVSTESETTTLVLR